jgi:gluconate kinase
MNVVIMGTPGSGKTTIGTLPAKRPRWEFVDADDFHPAANVEKMRQGIPGQKLTASRG